MELPMASIGFSEQACFSRVTGKEKARIKNKNEVSAEYRATPCRTLRRSEIHHNSSPSDRVADQINLFSQAKGPQESLAPVCIATRELSSQVNSA
jgi:hypothetical protein